MYESLSVCARMCVGVSVLVSECVRVFISQLLCVYSFRTRQAFLSRGLRTKSSNLFSYSIT